MELNFSLENSEKISKVLEPFIYDVAQFENVHFCATRNIFEQPKVEGHLTINDFPVVKKLKEAVSQYPTTYGTKHRLGQDELITITNNFVGNVVITFEKDRPIYPSFYSHFLSFVLKDKAEGITKNLNLKKSYDRQTLKFVQSEKFKCIKSINGIPVEILRKFFDCDPTFMKTAATTVFRKVVEGEVSADYLRVDLSEVVGDE